MKIGEKFGITQKEINEKKHNIFIPICLGNRFFVDNAGNLSKKFKQYLSWALDTSAEKVLVVIVDEIQYTNMAVRSSKSPTACINKAYKDGKIIRENVSREVVRRDAKDTVITLSWKEYRESNPDFWQTSIQFYREFVNNEVFRERVVNTTKTSIRDRIFNKNEYL